MTTPFKFRYVNELAGIFVLLCGGLFVAGVVLTGLAQGWFQAYNSVFIEFPLEGSSGLQKGAEVQMLGTQAGTVEEVTVRDDGTMQAVLNIRSDFFQYVRADSTVIIRKKFLVAGDAYVEVTRGTGPRLPPEGHTLRCQEGKEIIDSIQEFTEEVRQSQLAQSLRETSVQVREAVLAVLEQVRSFLEEYTAVAREITNHDSALQTLLARLDRIAGRIEAGEGPAGRFIADPVLGDQVAEIASELLDILRQAKGSLAQVQAVLDDVAQAASQLPDLSKAEETRALLDSILQDVKAATTHLPEMAAAVNKELADTPGMVLEIRANLREVEQLLEAVKRHWLIRSYVEEGEARERISPAAVPAGSPPEPRSEGGEQ